MGRKKKEIIEEILDEEEELLDESPVMVADEIETVESLETIKKRFEKKGSKEGTIIGIVAGLLYDLSFSMVAGPKAITYGLIGYACGKFNQNFYRENFILPFICTLFSSLFYSLTCIFSFMLRGKLNIIFFMKSIAIPEMIYTITLSLIVYQITYSINEKLEASERKTRNMF